MNGFHLSMQRSELPQMDGSIFSDVPRKSKHHCYIQRAYRNASRDSCMGATVDQRGYFASLFEGNIRRERDVPSALIPEFRYHSFFMYPVAVEGAMEVAKPVLPSIGYHEVHQCRPLPPRSSWYNYHNRRTSRYGFQY
jgi:hypothetical protein